jgi:hypothetical protein
MLWRYNRIPEISSKKSEDKLQLSTFLTCRPSATYFLGDRVLQISLIYKKKMKESDES